MRCEIAKRIARIAADTGGVVRVTVADAEALVEYVEQLEAALRDNVCSEGAVVDGRCMHCGTRGCGWARELLEAES